MFVNRIGESKRKVNIVEWFSGRREVKHPNNPINIG
uniref:Uncharacterized protein n=1 Tax=Siphoviridae sp. ctr4Z12 TaxID=2827280 RepID=A0A8S5R650_9CAUD|nr:MAG TPA: hypothetical protein [Siphoviridae sp. ctr4Z12]